MRLSTLIAVSAIVGAGAFAAGRSTIASNPVSTTQAMIASPRPSSQCLAKAPKIASLLKNSCSSAKAKAPISAPRRWPMPPRMIMISTAPLRCQLISSGLTKPSFTANRKPASPAMPPESVKAASLYG